MRYLKKDELNLVHPKFKEMILDAWKSNEKVPYVVIYLTYRKPSKADIEITKKIIKKIIKK
jgi:hypothetical protein